MLLLEGERCEERRKEEENILNVFFLQDALGLNEESDSDETATSESLPEPIKVPFYLFILFSFFYVL